ncbi:MAG: RNA-directed DNA polymerase [Rivularia sp. (in: cyanobacteria)]|jgi:retron-type reverse transcriptase
MLRLKQEVEVVRVRCQTCPDFTEQQLRGKKYIRYVDDFALFSDDKDFLAEARVAIEEYLCSLRLKLHPVKSQLFETRYGANFLGFRVLPDRIRVRTENLRRGRKKLRQLQKDYAQGKINYQDVSCSIQSWLAHLEHGDTWRLRQKIFTSVVFARE